MIFDVGLVEESKVGKLEGSELQIFRIERINAFSKKVESKHVFNYENGRYFEK